MSIWLVWFVCSGWCGLDWSGLSICIWILIEESLEVKLPTIWTDEKQRWSRRIEKKSRREKIREEKESEERRCRRAKT